MRYGVWWGRMQAEITTRIHQAIEKETVNFREMRRYGYIDPRKVSYIIHECGVSAYYKDFHIGESATQTEAIRKIKDMAEQYI